MVQPQPAYHAYYGAIDPRRSHTFGLPVGATMACHELFDADYVPRVRGHWAHLDG
jgi:hypothetical protein